MVILVAVLSILGLVIASVIFFAAKAALAPKKISTLSDLVKAGKGTAAVKMAKLILAKDPRNPEAHYFLGLAYLADGKAELALMEFKTVNQIGLFQGLLTEKEFRKQIAGLFERFEQGEEALKEYILLVKLDPNNPEYYYKAGFYFEERGKADNALKYYRKTLDLDPNHSDAHLRLGMLFLRANRPMEARQELDQALKLKPENYHAWFSMGRLLKEAHDINGALAAFEKAQKDPDLKVKALVERGSCFMSQKNYDRAMVELERALKLGSPDTEKDILYARYFLAHCYEKNRMIDKAIGEWEKIYSKKPTFKDVAEKLSAYQDLRVDDRIKDYVTSAKPQFLALCQGLVGTLGFSVQDSSELSNGTVKIIAIENESEKWRNVKKMPKILLFFRTSDPIDEPPLREVVEEIRKLGANKCYVVTNTAFTRAAIAFAETRPYELVGKDQLQALLKKTGA
ncbi:MAG TPA: tetratricopeptide repeat protein [Spirochaetia bacterium]|nr:tetratricopeptide repeat protein [Spirochaetia bacterium]